MAESDSDGDQRSEAEEDAVAVAAGLAVAAARRGSRPLDEEVLDEIAARLGQLPEPVAAAAANVEVARAEGDATGVRKRLFELGIAVVRYAVSVGLALVREKLGDNQAPRPLAEALQRAARLSDGGWCALGRAVASQLGSGGGAPPPEFDFMRRKALAELVTARNQFVHGGGAGDDAPELTLAVLEQAEPLLSLPLQVVTSLDPPSYQQRMGVPMRPGVWRKVRKAVPTGVTEGGRYLVHEIAGEPRWTNGSPWVPEGARKLLLVDSPHKGGAPWRWFDPETGEHRDDPDLDAAVRELAGQDTAAPVPPCDRPRLVGREQAIAVMRRAAELTGQGGNAVVVLTGPQGIGRGRMLETMREAAASFGFDQVLEASCLEHRRGVLRPLRRAVRSAAGLDSVSGALGRAAAGDALSGAQGLEAAVEAVEEALIDVSLDRPLMLLVDDLQWADESTLTLLALFTERATRKARGRVLVVAAVRDEPNPPASLTALIGQVERDVGAGATRLELEPLSAAESSKLVKSVAPLEKQLEHSLVDGAAGVPFLLVQSVLAWDETGGLEWREGAWHPASDSVAGGPVPGMAEVVQARIVSYFEVGSAAERTARQVLFAVGLAGGPLPLDQLTATLDQLGVETEQVEHALEALVEAGLLGAAPGRPEYQFAQPMVRHAVMESHRRKPWASRLQRALLEALSQADGADEDAAFIAGGLHELGDSEAASRWWRRAVNHALTMGLFRQAVEYADSWARLDAAPRERVEAALHAVEALLRAGDAPAAKVRLGAADVGETCDDVTAIRARILRVGVAHALGEASDYSDATLLVDADATSSMRHAIEARLAVAGALRAARGLELTAEAARLLPASGLDDLRYRVWVLSFELHAETGGIERPQCRLALERARAAAEELGSAWALLDADNDRALLFSAAGDQETAVCLLRRVAEEAKERRFGRMRRAALVNVATCLWRGDKPKEAAEAARAAAEAGRKAGDWHVQGVGLSVRADALRQLKDLPAARAAIDEAVEIKVRAGDANVAIALLRRADILVECALPGEALDTAERALGHATRAGNQDHVARVRLWIALHLDSQAAPGDTVQLAALVHELLDREGSLRGPTKKLLARAQQTLSEAAGRGDGSDER